MDGIPRIEAVIELSMTKKTSPQIKVKGCYITRIEGDPCIYSKHVILPKPGADISDPSTVASIGMTITGMPALNSIRAVVDAPPGCITSADLPVARLRESIETNRAVE